jgi:hypothetical protein
MLKMRMTLRTMVMIVKTECVTMRTMGICRRQWVGGRRQWVGGRRQWVGGSGWVSMVGGHARDGDLHGRRLMAAHEVTREAARAVAACAPVSMDMYTRIINLLETTRVGAHLPKGKPKDDVAVLVALVEHRLLLGGLKELLVASVLEHRRHRVWLPLTVVSLFRLLKLFTLPREARLLHWTRPESQLAEAERLEQLNDGAEDEGDHRRTRRHA